jgi:hypothetical protein
LKAAGLDLGTAQMISLLLSMGILWRPMGCWPGSTWRRQ